MNNYLHIFTDEKWTNSVVRQFMGSGPQNQEFIVLYKDSFDNLQYPLQEDLPLKKIMINTPSYNDLILKINSYSTVFVHFLDDLKFDLLGHIKGNTKLIWMCWGQDIHKMIIPDSYMPLTRMLLLKNKLWQEFLWKYTLRPRQFWFPYTTRGKLLHKFKYCCPVIYDDLYKTNKYLNLKIEYLEFHYSTLEDLLGKFLSSQCNGNNILIGNSSSYASNHLDVFEILRQYDLGSRKIIVPLNYGDSDYGDQIENAGHKLFGERFEALREFLDSDTYSSIIQSCSVAIFNHIRQQGLGTIIICLWMGIRIYLNEKGSLYNYLKSLDLPVFRLQSDVILGENQLFEPLDEQQHLKAKRILRAEFGAENTNRLILNLFKELSVNQVNK